MVRQQIAMPPRDLLGRFTRPGDCDAIAAWLRSLAPSPSTGRGNGGGVGAERRQGVEDLRLALSLDMLCYGGLVASRTLGTDTPTALARLNALRDLRQARPDSIIFAFSVIMRLGRTVTCAADLEDHLLLRTYSQLLDRVERLGETDARAELVQTQQRIAPERLAEYVAVRRRNHAINRAAVDLVAEGVLDYLVLAQEDAAPVGIHLPEQLALRAQVEEHRISDRIAMTCGADEMTMMLLARHVTAAARLAPGIAVDLAADSGGDIVPAFESQPLRNTVLDHIAIAGGRHATPADSDAILFVHTPVGPQQDIAESPPPGQAPSLALQAESVADRVEAASAAERAFGLADVAYCNGADPELLAALERRTAVGRLTAFAGWNTAANTLGTVISQLCMTAAAGHRLDQQAVRRFVASRLVDDYGYQSCARRQAVEHATAHGADPFRLGERTAETEAFVRSQLEPLAHRYLSLLIPGWTAETEPLRISLPWGRLFEVEVAMGATEPAAGGKNLQ